MGFCISKPKPDSGQAEYDKAHGLTAPEAPRKGNYVETGTEEQYVETGTEEQSTREPRRTPPVESRVRFSNQKPNQPTSDLHLGQYDSTTTSDLQTSFGQYDT